MVFLIQIFLLPLIYLKFKLHWKHYIGSNDLGKGLKFEDAVLNSDLNFLKRLVFMMHFGLPIFFRKKSSRESLPVKRLRIKICVILLIWLSPFTWFLHLLEMWNVPYLNKNNLISFQGVKSVS